MVYLGMDEREQIYNNILSGISKLEDLKTGEKNSDEEVKEIALRIRAYRAKHELSKQELAKRLEVSHNQIYRWESGKHKPGKMAMMILKAHGIT